MAQATFPCLPEHLTWWHADKYMDYYQSQDSNRSRTPTKSLVDSALQKQRLLIAATIARYYKVQSALQK